MELKDFDTSVTVSKRDGSEEKFSKKKLMRLLNWACGGNKTLAEEIMVDTVIKIHHRVTTKTLMSRLIETAKNKISLIHPHWEEVAAKLFLMDKYHMWYPDVSFRGGDYPHIKDVFKSGKYDVLGSYSEDEIEHLNSYIKPELDYLFVFSGAVFMFNKYCKGRELPQHTYMRVAMSLFARDSQRMRSIVKFYEILANHEVTMGTPIMINAGFKKQQLSSCVLQKVGDSTSSINDVMSALSLYSKYNGGNGIDITDVRCSGSNLSAGGKSSGGTPYVKVFEEITKAWDQSGSRPGAAVITFDAYTADFFSLVRLKRNDGTSETRARSLKYSVRVNKHLFTSAVNDDYVYLFDPKDTPKLFNSWGVEWSLLYNKAVEAGLWKQRVKAREVVYEILKTRVETGNLYLFFTDNVNGQNVLTDRFINSSNLCQEICQPSSPGGEAAETLVKNMDYGEFEVISTRVPPEISLCTLGSVNLSSYTKMSDERKREVTYYLTRALDNTFDVAFFPVAGARATSLRYRYIGIGVLNYAKMLAEHSLRFSDPESLEFVETVFSSLQENVSRATEYLAEEKGPYPSWDTCHGKKRRNALTMAIAPTATSGRAINATSSIEPPQAMFSVYDSTITAPSVVPDFKKLNKFYELAFDIDPYILVKHAAVRQKYLDQSQSVNMYLSGEYKSSVTKLFKLHEFALDSGLKTLYYAQTRKDGEEPVCESCT